MGVLLALMALLAFLGWLLGRSAKGLFDQEAHLFAVALAVQSALAWMGAGFLGAMLIATSL